MEMQDLEEQSLPKNEYHSSSSRYKKSNQSNLWSFDWLWGDFQPSRYLPSLGRYPRIIDREQRMFSQACGRISIGTRMNSTDRSSLYRDDWFHSLVHAPTIRILVILMSSYVSLIFIFAFLYYYIYKHHHNGCNLAFKSFNNAFIFSIETFATIGYGAPKDDIFFGHCESVTFVITLQCLVRLVAEASTIGVIYCRLARPSSRATTIIFSDKAVIRRIRGRLYFMFQLCELRKHQLVEAHIRLYVVKHEVDLAMHLKDVKQQQRREQSDDLSLQNRHLKGRSNPSLTSPLSSTPSPKIKTTPHIFIQSSTMRLNHPNDELGAMLLLMLPQVVVHEIDITSPLMPPPLWISARTGEIVRWNPPVYRTLRRRKVDNGPFGEAHMRQSMGKDYSKEDNKTSVYSQSSVNRKSSPMEDTEEGNQQQQEEDEEEVFDTYDVEAVSNIEFPSVQRRGIEIYAQTGMHSSPPPYHLHDRRDGPSPIPSISRLTSPAILASPPPASALNNDMIKKKGKNTATPLLVESLLNKNEGGERPSTTTPPPRLFPQLVDTHLLSHNDLESPGLKKYGSDLNLLSSLHQHSAAGSVTSSREHSAKKPPRNSSSSSSLSSFPRQYYQLNDSLLGNKSPTTSRNSQQHLDVEESNDVESPFLSSPTANAGEDNNTDEDDEENQPLWQIEEEEMIKRYLLDRKIEIIAIVEGVDATTGGSCQARHSYIAHDIEWNKTFSNCIFPTKESIYGNSSGSGSYSSGESNFLVDFDYFHKLQNAPKDAAYPGLIASSV
jgi:hypothetical protein